MNGTRAAEEERSQESTCEPAKNRLEHSIYNAMEESASAASSLALPATAAKAVTTETAAMSTTPSAAATATTTVKTTQAQTKEEDSCIPQIAKDRLSKWAARLFDPNRPRGVIQPPQSIPLNDEFLQAFGKREQEMDRITGNSMKIDRSIPDVEDLQVGEPTPTTRPTDRTPRPTADLPVDTNLPKDTPITSGSRNIKISNLRFTTTPSQLESLCKRFGDIEKTTLITNPADKTKNLGIAYILFESHTAAARCIAELKNVQNRPVTVTEARQPGERTNNNNNNNNTTKRKASRYWQTTDVLSIKCFHCGLYGHTAAACQNAKQLKPCTLCGFTSHDARKCDKKLFCHGCGLPGHASRECTFTDKPIRRLICTHCYGTDHHRSQCSSYRAGEPFDVQNAVCITCGKSGHFSCRRVTVFYGLKGICCCNCGAVGHSIQECQAPNLAMCEDMPPMLDGGWTADQAQAAIIYKNQPIRPNENAHHPQQQQYNYGTKKRRVI